MSQMPNKMVAVLKCGGLRGPLHTAFEGKISPNSGFSEVERSLKVNSLSAFPDEEIEAWKK